MANKQTVSKNYLLDFTASTSILLVPFLNFVHYIKYQFISAEIIIILMFFALAGAIVSLLLSHDSRVTRTTIYF